MKNVNYFNPIHQEENTPLVTILEVRTDIKQATAIDSRKSPYNIDLSKASFGAIYYPTLGSQWYLKKISGVWTLMARAPQQNPQLNPSFVPEPGETYIGGDGKTHIVGDLDVAGSLDISGDLSVSGETSFSDLTATSFNAIGSSVSDIGHSGMVEGDTDKRVIIRDDGTYEWGPGDDATDTNLYRSGVGELTTDGDLVVVGDLAGDTVSVHPSGETVPRIKLNKSSTGITFSNGTNAADTNLYRSAADVLKTDDSLVVGSSFTIGSVQIDPSSPSTGHTLRYNGTKFVSITEGMRNLGFTRQTNPGINTTSTSYIDIGTALSVTKALAGSKLRVQIGGTAYAGANNVQLDFGIKVTGISDIDVAVIASTNNVPLAHGSWQGLMYVSGVATGSITVQLRGKVTGTGSLRMDAGDWFYIDVCECA